MDSGCRRPYSSAWWTRRKQLQHSLLKIMDQEKGSLRFYYLGNRYQSKIEHFGAKETYAPEGVLMV